MYQLKVSKIRNISQRLLCVTLLVSASASQATVIDKFMLINPIQICETAGTNCSTAPLSVAETQAIYEQAGVAAIYLPTTQLNNTSLLTVGSVVDVNLAGNGQSTNANTLNVWFAESLTSPPNTTLFGEAYVNGNGAVINSNAVTADGRLDTVAHEIGHNLGLGHTDFGAGDVDNVLTSGNNRNAPAMNLTADQITQIRNSVFTQDAPEINVDLRGSTPFQTDDFFDISFDNGPTGVSLTKFTIDLSPADAFFDVSNAPPGNSGSGLATSGLTGVSLADLTFSGLTDGSQFMTLDIAEGKFTAGDSMAFGTDIDLFSMIDSFGATSEELLGIKFGFEFDIGLSLEATLDSDLVTGTLDLSQINSFFGNPVPFGPQVAPGQLPPGSNMPVIGTPVANAVPIPGTFGLLVLGLLTIATRRLTKLGARR